MKNLDGLMFNVDMYYKLHWRLYEVLRLRTD